MVPTALEMLMYSHSEAFTKGVMEFDPNRKILLAGLNIQHDIMLSIFMVLWFFICAASFWKQIKDSNDLYKWAVYIPLAVVSIMFSLIIWHAQWLLLITPFFAISTFTHKKADFFIWIDILMMYFFIAFCVNLPALGVDRTLWGLGIFKNVSNILCDPNTGIFMRNIFLPNDTTLYYSLFVGCFIVNIYFKYPEKEYSYWNGDEKSLSLPNHWNLVRASFLIGIAVFLIPAVISILSII